MPKPSATRIKSLIAARQEIERDKIRQQTEAQVQAFTRVTTAQGEQEAAAKQAEARLQLAQAEAQSRELVARGEKAQQLVPVEVSLARTSASSRRG